MTEIAQIMEQQGTAADHVLARLRNAARAAEAWHLVHRPMDKGTFQVRAEAARQALKRMEGRLAQIPLAATEKVEHPYRPALLELHANSRLLRAAVTAVSDKPSKVSQLVRVNLIAEKQEVPALPCWLKVICVLSMVTFRRLL